MKRKLQLLPTVGGIMMLTSAAAFATGVIKTENISFSRGGGKMHLTADLILDSLRLKSEQQMFVTPVLTGEDGETAVLPTILLTGRGMHYAYERGTMRDLKKYRRLYDISKEVRRENGKPQTIGYAGSVPLEKWMRTGNVEIELRYDTCGCGVYSGSATGLKIDTTFNPVTGMRLSYITPKVTDLPVSIHEGRARVQFEVDRTQLHDNVYRARNGQVIDNREQLKVIYDSIEYALTDPNVEIAKIEIIGYASPESPYEHNKELATGRSRALAQYIGNYVGNRYSIDPSLTDFDAVPENWAEFREQVVASKEISEAQRKDLLELIDSPAFGPADYDAKERELKNNPKFKELYQKKILPQWFPHLRATRFRISTRLKPMTDDKLAEIITVAPEKMSLNQMMRVARLYKEGSDEFNNVIETALKYYPESEEANLNAAVTALNNKDYQRAAQLLERAGDSAEAVNARGVLHVANGEFEEAKKIFEQIDSLPEAQKNLNMLEDE